MSDRILFVDDDENVLEGYKRLLRDEFRDEFTVDTAQGAGEAAAAIHLFGPYAVVISDMRMPGVNGAQFLAQMRQLGPYTVRMLLTGFKDIDEAIAAVNDGRIFRYLAKPCAKDDLVNAIKLGLAQFHKNIEEKEIVKQAREIKPQEDELYDILQS